MTSPVSAVEAIEKAMEGVTPGPWQVSRSGAYMTELRAERGRRVAATWVQGPAKSREGALNQARVNEANASYIAACSPDRIREVLALARQAEALQRENAELRRIGGGMANVLHHWKQQSSMRESDRRTMADLQQQWDAISARALLGGYENAGN